MPTVGWIYEDAVERFGKALTRPNAMSIGMFMPIPGLRKALQEFR